MNFKSLNKNNFMMYAMKMYTNPQCVGMDEFNEDLNRIKYIKRLLGRYDKKGFMKIISSIFKSTTSTDTRSGLTKNTF